MSYHLCPCFGTLLARKISLPYWNAGLSILPADPIMVTFQSRGIPSAVGAWAHGKKEREPIPLPLGAARHYAARCRVPVTQALGNDSRSLRNPPVGLSVHELNVGPPRRGLLDALRRWFWSRNNPASKRNRYQRKEIMRPHVADTPSGEAIQE